jgi:hypothetical protein
MGPHIQASLYPDTMQCDLTFEQELATSTPPTPPTVVLKMFMTFVHTQDLDEKGTSFGKRHRASPTAPKTKDAKVISSAFR